MLNAATLHRLLTGTVRALRLGMHSRAHRGLERLLPYLSVVADRHVVDAGSAHFHPLFMDLATSFDRADYLRVADLLEYKIAPLLPALQHDA